MSAAVELVASQPGHATETRVCDANSSRLGREGVDSLRGTSRLDSAAWLLSSTGIAARLAA